MLILFYMISILFFVRVQVQEVQEQKEHGQELVFSILRASNIVLMVKVQEQKRGLKTASKRPRISRDYLTRKGSDFMGLLNQNTNTCSGTCSAWTFLGGTLYILNSRPKFELGLFQLGRPARASSTLDHLNSDDQISLGLFENF